MLRVRTCLFHRPHQWFPLPPALAGYVLDEVQQVFGGHPREVVSPEKAHGDKVALPLGGALRLRDDLVGGGEDHCGPPREPGGFEGLELSQGSGRGEWFRRQFWGVIGG